MPIALSSRFINLAEVRYVKGDKKEIDTLDDPLRLSFVHKNSQKSNQTGKKIFGILQQFLSHIY